MFYYDPTWGPIRRAGYGREPYVLITPPDERMLEGRVQTWTRDKALAAFLHPERPPQFLTEVAV